MLNPLNIFDNDSDDVGTSFRDVIFIMGFAFLAIIFILIPFINDPGKLAEADIKTPGNVIVEIHWPNKIIDVDLWILAPGAERPIGYSNQNGKNFNLLRDDLGQAGDATNLNYENAYSRGIKKGRYTVNVHLFANAAKLYPVKVLVVVSIKKKGERLRQILTRVVYLKTAREEITVFNFKLDKDGNLIKNSVDILPKCLFCEATPRFR